MGPVPALAVWLSAGSRKRRLALMGGQRPLLADVVPTQPAQLLRRPALQSSGTTLSRIGFPAAIRGIAFPRLLGAQRIDDRQHYRRGLELLHGPSLDVDVCDGERLAQ